MKSEHTKIVIVGGSGLIGKKLGAHLRERGHEVLAASPSHGVNSVTGEGLADALKGAAIVVDLTNSPSFEDKAVLDFFEKSTRNLLETEKAQGVGHHVALTIVGSEQLPHSGYLRAKVAQEKLIQSGGVPYTIVRATQFFEFVGAIAQSATQDDSVRLPSALLQPILSDDVAAALVDIVLGEPLNGTLDLAGPDAIPMADVARQYLKATHDPRTVITDDHATYFGTQLRERSLVPQGKAILGSTHFSDWLSKVSF